MVAGQNTGCKKQYVQEEKMTSNNGKLWYDDKKQIWVTNEQHILIKTKASKRGLSMGKYLVLAVKKLEGLKE